MPSLVAVFSIICVSNCPARPTIDWRDAVMYFVMVDRFNDGTTANDMPLGLRWDRVVPLTAAVAYSARWFGNRA